MHIEYPEFFSSINWGFPWVLLFRKRKTENIPTASIDWERSNQAVAEYLWIFLQIFANSRFDLAKVQNSAWFVKKFLTYNCGRNWALQICSGTFHIFCRRELAWSWIQGSGPPSCRAINPPEHTHAQVIYGFSQIYCHAWSSIAANNL